MRQKVPCAPKTRGEWWRVTARAALWGWSHWCTVIPPSSDSFCDRSLCIYTFYDRSLYIHTFYNRSLYIHTFCDRSLYIHMIYYDRSLHIALSQPQHVHWKLAGLTVGLLLAPHNYRCKCFIISNYYFIIRSILNCPLHNGLWGSALLWRSPTYLPLLGTGNYGAKTAQLLFQPFSTGMNEDLLQDENSTKFSG